jgi:hypothetical protein
MGIESCMHCQLLASLFVGNEANMNCSPLRLLFTLVGLLTFHGIYSCSFSSFLACISALPAIWCSLVALNMCGQPKYGREGTRGCYQSFDMALCEQ